MIQIITTTKAIGTGNNRREVTYVSGFTRTASALRPEAEYAILANLAVTGATRKAAEKAVKAYEMAVKPVTVKGAAVLACLQGAHRVTLSKGERRFLLAEMRILEAESGISSEAILKAA